eukprot:TRINITY_DN906_c0_g1_i1.p1 TRINITY_DN906_c0_g1~~TRINITY_DN906_c0_g1_i1.p1  ORF type:complete len:861 (+),score=318.92 TRINITY_DN906_c0_g1_i1:123-2705(+)
MSADGKTSVVQTSAVEVPSVDKVTEQLSNLTTNVPLVSTLASGQVPSNREINDAIDKAKTGIESTRDDAHLNTHGDKLVKDATAILESAQKFINEKNQGEKLQELIQHTKDAGNVAAKQTGYATSTIRSLLSSTLGFTFPTDKAKSDAQDAYNYGRELVLFAMRSKEFRSLLLDCINFFQSAIDEANAQAQQLGDSLKTDVKNADSNMTAASNLASQKKEEVKDAAQNKISEWSEQTRRQYYQRFQSLLNRIAEKPEYKRLLDLYWKWMDELKTRANEWTENLKTKAAQTKDVAVNAASKAADQTSTAMDKVWFDVRDIVDTFAGVGSFDLLYNELWSFYCDICNDPVATAYLENLRAFVTDAINNPASLNVEQKQREGEQLLQRGQNLINSARYTGKYNKLVKRANNLFDRVANDRTTNELGDRLAEFGRDFALDSQGRPDLYVMQDSLGQIKNLVYPLLTQQLGSMAIARIAGSNDTYDWKVENVSVQIPDIVPEHFRLRTKNILDINIKGLETEKNNTKVVMELTSLRPVFRDLKFWYLRKTFPRIEDQGIVDVDLSRGNGAKIKIIWKIKSNANRPFAFSLMEVKCDIDSLDVRVKEAKHDFLDRLATTFFAANFRQSLAASIVNSLVDSLQPLNDQMNNWFASRPISSVYEKANVQLHNAFDSANAAIKDRPVDRLMEKAKDTLEYVKEGASDSISKAKDVISEKAAEARDYLTEQNPGLVEKAAQVRDTIVDKAADLKNAAIEAKDTLMNKTGQEATLGGKLEAAKELATDKAAEIKGAVSDKMEELSSAIKSDVSTSTEGGPQPAIEVPAPKEYPWTHKWSKQSKKNYKKQAIKTDNPYNVLSEQDFPVMPSK